MGILICVYLLIGCQLTILALVIDTIQLIIKRVNPSLTLCRQNQMVKVVVLMLLVWPYAIFMVIRNLISNN